MNYTLYQMGWILVLYSIIGWCGEVAFAAMKRGVFVNRGFLNGPVCPIYGFGVLIVVLCLEPFKDSLVLLFFGSMILTTLLEFFTGFVLEKFFHDKWWDYSSNPFNIKGYVCLEASIMWGIACCLVMDVVHPLVMKLINLLPYSVGKWLLPAVMLIFAVDGVLTVMEILKMPKRFKTMQELEKAITAVSDSMGENIYESVEWGKERRDAFNEKHPELAEKKNEASRNIQQRRTEISQKNTANKEAAAKKKAELESRLAELKNKSIVQRRITRAYPQLGKGEHYGENFRKLKAHYDGMKNRKKAKKEEN